jgi:hypothetical protein
MFSAVRKFIQGTQPDPAANLWHKQFVHTPDLWLLEQYPRQRVFIADDLKTGKVNHKLIKEHRPVHPDVYTLQKYTMWKKDLGGHSYPLPFEPGHDAQVPSLYRAEPARIKGELYVLPSNLFWNVLDKHKQNGVQFTRKRVLITVPWRTVSFETDRPLPVISSDQTITIDAWMYVARPEYWDDYLGVHLGSKAVDTYAPNSPKVWLDEYYKF